MSHRIHVAQTDLASALLFGKRTKDDARWSRFGTFASVTGGRALVERFRGSNHIGLIHQPRPEEPTEGRRLERRPQARPCQWPSLKTPCCARLDRMRPMGGQFDPPDLMSFMESIHKFAGRCNGNTIALLYCASW